MNVRNVKRNFSLIPISIIVIFFACTKIVTTNIGSSLIPPGDGVLTKDTFIDLSTKNIGDSAIYPGLADDQVLGYTSDPFFGKTSAQINVQIQPSFFPYSFQVSKDSLYLDSAVLVLHCDGIYGDSTQNLALRVFQIANSTPLASFTKDSLYSTNATVPANIELTDNGLPAYINPASLKDSVHVFQDSGVNQVRIRLSTDFMRKFVNGYDASSTYASDTTFNNDFRGFQISADPTGNALLKINLLNTDTKLALYYRYQRSDSAGKQDTTVRYFNVNSGTCAHSNYIKRDRSGSQLANYYPSANTEDSLLFLEAGPGVFSQISVPDLSGLQNIMIHRAELLMEEVPDNSTNNDQLFPPPNLLVTAYSSDSAKRVLLYSDMIGSTGLLDLTTFGSYPVTNYDATSGKIYYTYNFNISRYIQGLADSKYKPFKLVLYAPYYNEYLYATELSTHPYSIGTSPINTVACGRIRLGGGNNTQHRMRLHIVYSLQ